MSCLYILDINPSLVISFANIFSHTVGCFFDWAVVSFAVQKLLSLIRSHLSIFAFVFFALGDRSKKLLLRFMSKSILLMFSPQSFMVSRLTFRYLINFEFTFIFGERKCSKFILLHVVVQFFPTPLIEETVFSPLYILVSFIID